MTRRRIRDTDEGVAVIEMLMFTPVLILVALVVTQVAIVAMAGSAAQDAALAAARADQLGLPEGAAGRAAVDNWLDVEVVRLGENDWRATVTTPQLVPFFDTSVIREAELP